MKSFTVALSVFSLAVFGQVANAQVKVRGSEATLKIVQELAEGFHQETGKTVIIEGGGSSAGVKGLIAGEVSIAFLSRSLKSSEEASGLIGYPYAKDGVAVIVNSANPIESLSMAELKAIFTGSTTQWPDGKPVVVFNRNANSGNRETFQEKVLGSDSFTPKAINKHDGVLIPSVAKLPASIGYISLMEVDPTKVKILGVNGIKPEPTSLRDGSYSISRTSTFATKGPAAGEEKAFIDFVLSPKGQAIVARGKLSPIK